MTSSAVAFGMLIGGAIGWLMGYLYAWQEAQELLSGLRRRRADRDKRRNAKHFYRA